MERIAGLLVIALLGGSVVFGGLASAQQPATPANATDAHVNPETAGESGDLGQLSNWLSTHVSDQLETGAVQLSQGQYQAAEGVVSEQLEDRLSQFIDVAGETEGDSDDQAAETARETATAQRTLTTATREYWNTYDRYQENRQEGDDTAARQLARRLERLSERVAATGSRTQTGYQRLENQTGTTLENGTEAVESVTENITETQAEVRSDTFVTPSLDLEQNRTAVGFDAPLGLVGQLRKPNGTAIDNRSIRVRVGTRNVSVNTNSSGEFRLAFRPIASPVDQERLPVRYLPQPTAPYLGTVANATIDITPVTPTLELSVNPTTVGFGDRLTSRSTLTVDGRAVPNVPVVSSVGSQFIGRAVSDGEEPASLSASLAATVEPGEGQVRARIPWEGRAIERTATTVSVDIIRTDTVLDVAGTATTGQIRVTGELRSIEGHPVANQSINVQVRSVSRYVETNTTGRFTAVLEPEASTAVGDNVTLTAVFDGSGTNLAGSEVRQVLTVRAVSEPSPIDRLTSEGPLLLLGVALVVGAVLVGLWYRSSTTAEQPIADRPSTESGQQPSKTAGERWLESARSALQAGQQRAAIIRAYAATQAHLSNEFDLSDGLTARERLAAVERRLDDGRREALADLTAAYERAVFAGDAVDAQPVLTNAGRIVDRSSGE